MSSKAKASRVRRTICVFLTLLALFLVGTVIVLSTVVQYFGVDWRDVITEPEMRLYERLAEQAKTDSQPIAPTQTGVQSDLAANLNTSVDTFEAGLLDSISVSTDTSEFESSLEERALATSTPVATTATNSTIQPRIPKIIHQTWKTDILPERWDLVRKGCIDMHPDYEFKLWSDASSREFIATHYNWFLSAFDNYPYPIQRADAIRYFVLHYYGGIYMDLDVGCRRSMDPLLYFQVILPATIPVGVSNDVMLAERGHPFMNLVINNLITFNHQYGTNYPTVMFSTGPMFLSAQYGLWPKEDVQLSDRQVRVLPRRWYGKNAPATEMGDSFFDHFYGSSWHADDAGFITFLGKFGMILMYLGAAVVFVGGCRLVWSKRFLARKSARPAGPIALPFSLGPDGIPFTRPNTPGGGNSRVGSPNSHSRGVLYYLPVWLLPHENSSNRSPNLSDYLPKLYSDAEQGNSNYAALQNISRPNSPSNNSIYAAPGAHHDGAFDGLALENIHHAKNYSSPPNSPNPPAYSNLKGWTTNLFKSPRTNLLPTTSSSAASPNLSGATAADPLILGHSRQSSTSSARSKTPNPQSYSTPNMPTSPAEGLSYAMSPSTTELRGRGMIRSQSGNTPHPTTSTSNSVVGSDSELDEFPSNSDTNGFGLEAEVDAILNEMAPDFEAKLAKLRQNEQ